MGATDGKTTRGRTLSEAYRRAGLGSVRWHRADLALAQRLARRGVTTVPELVASFDALPRRTQRAALKLLLAIEDRRSAPLLVRLFEEVRFCPLSCIALGVVGGRRALRHLMGVVDEELARPRAARDLGRLQCALYALETMQESAEATELFVRTARETELPVHLRATALLALGMAAEVDPRALPHRRRVVALVRSALEDPSPTVRLGAVQAAGLMRLRSARDALERIVRTDRTRVRGEGALWRSAQEALAALDA